MNYIDYLIQLRIDKAKELLTGTNLKIHDIAEQVGYQPSYFIRLFKKMEDMTPGQYRERA
ncbi:HTH-type transcriptional regulator YesS [compost metagenome]